MAAAGTVARWCIGGITLCQGETTVSPRHTRTHTQARRAEPRRRDETTRPARATMDHLPPPPPPRAPRMLPRARRRPHADDRTGARCIPLPTHTPPRTTCVLVYFTRPKPTQGTYALRACVTPLCLGRRDRTPPESPRTASPWRHRAGRRARARGVVDGGVRSSRRGSRPPVSALLRPPG